MNTLLAKLDALLILFAVYGLALTIGFLVLVLRERRRRALRLRSVGCAHCSTPIERDEPYVHVRGSLTILCLNCGRRLPADTRTTVIGP